jgi:hypothetical protein
MSLITDIRPIHDYLEAFRNGSIKQGLGIDVRKLDKYLRHKRPQFNMVLGLDNVGKTDWMLWYFMLLTELYQIKHCVWLGENATQSAIRKLIQFKTGKYLSELTSQEVYRYATEVMEYFTFVDNRKAYTNKDLYKIFEDSGADNCFIDPFTGLNRQINPAANYEMLNETREFTNRTNKTLYLSTHPNTEAARRRHTKGEFEGYPQFPHKSDSEGGQPFANRCDDFIVIHRYLGHPTFGSKTLVQIQKVKETETGGGYTPNGEFIAFNYNGGKGFICEDDEIEYNPTIKDFTQPNNEPPPF